MLCALSAGDFELDRRFRLMLTASGIGETSALQILDDSALRGNAVSPIPFTTLQCIPEAR
jgi:hypothetical protein